ncbi:MAG: sulfite exporter TauE/SafE family protein [Gallionella sp.]|nr:sulfite exporter TauE/SafE family protein [Gallionella sp.]MDD4946558.1 sulfite exporter TauE/SafE family protein [Gallionella sp.]MDD5613178.1 sulfite exporter TauE/SafE family protein [Gallionella sp.]
MLAVLYSVTGHGGASGYIAVMVLLGFAPQEIKPLALVLNVVVSTVATILFYRAGHFRWNLFWPFVVGSVPLAMVGGYLQLPTHWFNLLLGVVLIFSALRIAIRTSPDADLREPAFVVAMLSGAGIGFFSGLIGIGGGIVLTPLILLMGWANPKQAAAVSAPFILLNSLSGLMGFSVQAAQGIQHDVIPLALTVLMGGLLGSYLGSRTLPMKAIARVLSAVLLIAGFKLFYV